MFESRLDSPGMRQCSKISIYFPHSKFYHNECSFCWFHIIPNSLQDESFLLVLRDVYKLFGEMSCVKENCRYFTNRMISTRRWCLYYFKELRRQNQAGKSHLDEGTSNGIDNYYKVFLVFEVLWKPQIGSHMIFDPSTGCLYDTHRLVNTFK